MLLCDGSRSVIHDIKIPVKTAFWQWLPDSWGLDEEGYTGKPIGPQNKERLQDLADDLHSGIETLTAMNYVSKLTNQATLLKTAKQLPIYSQARVKRELCRFRDSKSVPDISFLARLIHEGANESYDPVYGKLGMRCDKVPASPGKVLTNRH